MEKRREEARPKTFLLADWRYRHAGLMAISATGEGCHKEMAVLLDDLVNGILVFLKDSVRCSLSFSRRETSIVDLHLCSASPCSLRRL